MTDNLPAHFSEQDVENALHAAALCGGNSKEASKQLAEHLELDVPAGTILKWTKHQHRARYIAIRDQRAPEVAKIAAAHQEDMLLLALEKEREGLELLDLRKLVNRPEALAQAVGNLAKTAASHTDKAQLLRDRPTQITENRSVEEVLDNLDRKVGEYVDSTAIEEAA